MIINENGWGDKKAPKKETNKPQKAAPVKKVVKNAKQK